MKFVLITPAQSVANISASYVNVPSESGDFGVLPGHMPLIAILRSGGQVSVTDQTGAQTHFTISGGFADVRTDGVTILAESITDAPAAPLNS